MAYKAFITYLACGATIACSQKHKFFVSFFRYNAYIKLNREICNELLISSARQDNNCNIHYPDLLPY